MLFKNINILLQNTESIVDNQFVQENLQLSSVVLGHRELFNIDEKVIKKLCNILIDNSDSKIFFCFLEVIKDNEFEFFAKSLSNKTVWSKIFKLMLIL